MPGGDDCSRFPGCEQPADTPFSAEMHIYIHRQEKNKFAEHNHVLCSIGWIEFGSDSKLRGKIANISSLSLLSSLSSSVEAEVIMAVIVGTRAAVESSRKFQLKHKN